MRYTMLLLVTWGAVICLTFYMLVSTIDRALDGASARVNTALEQAK